MLETKNLFRVGALLLAVGALSCLISNDALAQRRGDFDGRNYRRGGRNVVSFNSSSRPLNFSYGRGGPSRGYVAGHGFGTYRAQVFTRPARSFRDARYIDYHPGRYVYVPPHYHSRGGRWDY